MSAHSTSHAVSGQFVSEGFFSQPSQAPGQIEGSKPRAQEQNTELLEGMQPVEETLVTGEDQIFRAAMEELETYVLR